MIYLLIFIYLLFLSIHFDILENRGNKWMHYRIAVVLLILVAGLRWRVGSDTVVYVQDFVYSHDLFHLQWSDFASVGRMPFWVLLNAICKTIWNDFLLLQFVVAAFTLGVTGYFIKKVCPSLCFFVLLCYFIGGRYSSLQMELLRESMAVGFYLLGILSINEKQNRYLLYFLCAIMFHIFAFIAVAILLGVLYAIPRSNILRVSICLACLIFAIVGGDIFISIVQNGFINYVPNDEISSMILTYSMSSNYGNIGKSIVNYLWLIVQFLAYIFMLYKVEKIFPEYIYLERNLFKAGIFICITLLCLRYSFLIVYRIGLNYNYFFTCFLAVVFAKELLINRVKQRLLVFGLLLIIPLFFSLKLYIEDDYMYENNKWYSRYYPYSTILDKTFVREREMLHGFRGCAYTKETDY